MYRSYKVNRLAQERSLYLLQHAHNPVDWYPWCQEAIEKARRENKLILLSIGYSACHWCHVMAHESFEDKETAELMNRLFVNIKVDKEERPDLDKIYQTTHYLLTHRGGGWPLTVFLTPDDCAPFFSGTYFPPEERHQLPAFKEVLQTIAQTYQQQKAEIKKQNSELKKILQQHIAPDRHFALNTQPQQLAIQQLEKSHDSIYGGFGNAPKFPQPTLLTFLLHTQPSLLFLTLEKMAKGGLYDQLSGGFFRYSVDEKWEIPHFEKMLYDNGQLISLYSLASIKFKSTFFAEIAKQTARWVIEAMQSPEGGYYSSLDADIEGHEGQYYVWNMNELKQILTIKEFNIITYYFGLDKKPNFETQFHFILNQSAELIAQTLKIDLLQVNALIASAKQKLFSARTQRTTPIRDNKILTSWNALMIKGMLLAGSVLKEQSFIDSAYRAIEFIQNKLWYKQCLIASDKENKSNQRAYLDDYAFLIDALLTSLHIRWNKNHLLFAIELADFLITQFNDQEKGGFFFTAHDHESLLYRPKSFQDEALPSGNGIAAQVLLSLGYLIGEPRYLSAAENTIRANGSELAVYPVGYPSLLLALKNLLEPHLQIIIRGSSEVSNQWKNLCDPLRSYSIAIPDDETSLPGHLNAYQSKEKTCAYVCRGLQCIQVIDDLEEFKSFIT